MATTTEDAIRDRAIVVIESLVPTLLAGDRFRAWRNEGAAEFIERADNNASAAFRRFQVLTTMTDEDVESSNGDIETHFVELVIIVAYPYNARAGVDQALSRHKLIHEDRHLIESAIGMRGAANFTPPHPDATWRSKSDPVREPGRACEFLVLRQRMSFARVMPVPPVTP